jgi:sirohydrochlorin ferrochelatase
MAAPALVALAHGSRDPRSAETITALVEEVRALRPDLRIEPAFLELSKPSFQTVVNKLVRARYDEIVVVPLLLTDAHHAKVDVPEAVAAATARHEGLKIRSTSILGMEASFLEVLDLRMREALKASRVRELDALVLAAAGSSDALANQAVARLARTASPVAGGGSPAHRRRLDVPGTRLPSRPGCGAGTGSRRGGRLGAAGCPRGARPHGPGPLRRRSRGARPRLSRQQPGAQPPPWLAGRQGGATDEPDHQVLELDGRVGGDSAVDRARL